jgi:exoribonuclease II
MHILFEEGGKFQTARLMSQSDNSVQAEMASGKRLKLKLAQVLLQFDQPAPEALLSQAQELASSMDVDLAWECASEEEFGFGELAQDYFQPKPSVVEQAASLMCLFQAPHYFRRAGKGRFKKASAEVVQQALAAIEKKKQTAALIAQWAQQLMNRECPAPIVDQLYKILFKPDKNSPEYKAVVEAAKSSQTAPLMLLKEAGAIRSAYEFHWKRFAFDFFPKGTAFPQLQAPAVADDLPLADVQAFSIDDSQTTEIDDALSVKGLGTGQVTLGIHIAAPGLAVLPGSAIDKLARERYSTVYMPGQKITMLPDPIVQQYTLAEGQHCPALSLYVQIDEASLAVLSSESKLERVPIAHNLRHDQIDHLVSEEWLRAENPDQIGSLPSPDLHSSLSFLYRLATHLKSQREQVRGKPESFSRPDYNFRVALEGETPQGDEAVEISVRRRGAPLDLIVAECMILANSSWGQWLAKLGVPGIYRSQASLAPGVKVRMGSKALPHAGIGVPSYAWSTSPLRRYVDLVNQWQLIACVRHGATAALAAPFKPKDAELFAIISGFDAAYTAYNQFQSGMERYWTMKFVQQQGMEELTASVINAGLVRAEAIPLVLTVAGTAQLARGSRVRVRIANLDLLMLEASASLIERLDAASSEVAEEEELEDDAPVAGVHLALDLNDSDAADTPDAPA